LTKRTKDISTDTKRNSQSHPLFSSTYVDLHYFKVSKVFNLLFQPAQIL